MALLQAFCVSAAICIALIFLLQVGTWEDVIHWEKTYSFRPLGLLPGFLWTSTGLRWGSTELYLVSLLRRFSTFFRWHSCQGLQFQDPFFQESEPVTLVTEKPTAKRLMSRYASLLDSSLFKVLLLNLKWIYYQRLSYQAVVLTITAGLLAFGIYGSVNIVQRFEIIIEEERLCQEKNLSLQVWPDKDAAARELLVRMDPHTEPVLALLRPSSPGFVLREESRDDDTCGSSSMSNIRKLTSQHSLVLLVDENLIFTILFSRWWLGLLFWTTCPA